MTYKEQVFKLYHRGMLWMWVLFIIIVSGLFVWARNNDAIPVPLPIDGWVIIRFVPVMMGFVTLASCLQFLGLGSIQLYFNIRTVLIVGVCFLAYIATGTYVAGIWKFLPYVILLFEIVLLLVFAEMIDQQKLIARMVKRLPESSMSKFKLVVWPAIKIQNYCLWLMFSALGGIILFLFHEGWATYVDGALTSLWGAIIWWALTVIGIFSFWHWVLIWLHNVADALHGIVRCILYAILVALLIGEMYWLGFGLDALLVSGPLLLMSIIFSGEFESMRLWNRTHNSE